MVSKKENPQALKSVKNIENTPYHSLKVGPLCQGCEQCVKGEKLVIFTTGVCPARCFYCPISPEKKNKDVIYANERLVKEDEDILAEARSTRARGASFTGGDPLARLNRTVHYIKLLKKEFGKRFHLHLYTPLNLVTKERLSALYEAGLDEIRFHPFLERKEWWPRIEMARFFNWKIGVEIPVLPDKNEETKSLLSFLKGKIDFLNLNELEISELNEEAFKKKGYLLKSYDSYGVLGCEEAAKDMMRFVSDEKLEYPVHYCTCKLKDLVQMGNRLKRQAAASKLPFDLVDSEGLVTRGAIYHSLLPGTGYEKSIEKLSEEERLKEIKTLEEVLSKLKSRFSLKSKECFLDQHKPRILVPADWIVNHASEIEWPSAIVTEYPTWDSFPIEIEFLNGELIVDG